MSTSRRTFDFLLNVIENDVVSFLSSFSQFPLSPSLFLIVSLLICLFGFRSIGSFFLSSDHITLMEFFSEKEKQIDKNKITRTIECIMILWTLVVFSFFLRPSLCYVMYEVWICLNVI